MLRPFLLALTIGTSITMPALAGCEDPKDQAEINQCAGAAFQAADAELNSVYQQLLSKIDPDYVPSLRAAQRAWVPFRDTECEFESMGWEGGSGRPMIQSGCLARLTQERTALLKEFLTCDPESYEGNKECPSKK